MATSSMAPVNVSPALCPSMPFQAWCTAPAATVANVRATEPSDEPLTYSARLEPSNVAATCVQLLVHTGVLVGQSRPLPT
jgi:hypothetical protein